MLSAEKYMQQLLDELVICFGKRLVYVGLQGSYMRGEATEDSDIDPMVVINNLCVADLDVYRQIVVRLDNPDKSCGFICGTEELHHWNPLEICHLVHSIKDVNGGLQSLVPSYNREDIRNFVKISVNNLYHEITHRYLHSSLTNNQAQIAGSYKGVFFVLQNLHYLETGDFITTKHELLSQLSQEDAKVLKVAMDLDNGGYYDFMWLFELLHVWCRNVIQRV